MVDRHFSHLVDDSSGWCTECGGEKKLQGIELTRQGSSIWTECKECGTLFHRPPRQRPESSRSGVS